MASALTAGRAQQLQTIRFAVRGIAGCAPCLPALPGRRARRSSFAAMFLACIAKCHFCSKAQCRIRTNVAVASVRTADEWLNRLFSR